MARIAVVGMPGSGKSSVARLVARRLALEFVDTDVLMELTAGMPAAQLLREIGEPDFRRREIDALERALGQDAVVATGGGVVTTETGRQLLRHQPCVWLKVSVATLETRVKRGDRPLLGRDVREGLERLLQQRESQYAVVCGATVNADQARQKVVEEVLALVGELKPCE